MTRANKLEPESLSNQSKKFISTAHAIGCDEDAAAFKERLKKLVASPVKKEPAKPKTAKTSK